MSQEYADRVTMTVIEGSVEEITEKTKPYGIDTHGLVGLVGDEVLARQSGHAWGPTPEKARSIIKMHLDKMLSKNP